MKKKGNSKIDTDFKDHRRQCIHFILSRIESMVLPFVLSQVICFPLTAGVPSLVLLFENL